MKKTTLLLKRTVLLMAMITGISCLSLKAQRYRLAPFAGYSLQETFSAGDSRISLRAGAHFGAILEYGINQVYALELMYQRQDTKADIMEAAFRRTAPATLNWYLLGGVNYFRLGATNFSGIAGLYIGAGSIGNSSNNRFVMRFASGAKAGMTYRVNGSLSIRLQTQGLLMLGGPGNVWVEDGTGAVGYYESLVQLGFTGALVLSLRGGAKN